MIPRLGIFFLLLCFLVGTTGTAPAAGLERILVSTFPVWQFVRNITAGTGVHVDLLLPAQMGCPHDYALSPQDMRKLEQCDIFVVNGLGLEEFLGAPLPERERILIDGSAGLEGLLPAMEEEHQHGESRQSAAQDQARAVNPHIFASPRLAARMVRSIAGQLAQADPQRASRFLEQAEAYAAKLENLSREMAERGQALRNRRIITQHGVFDYLARDLGLEIVAVVQAHPGQAPSAAGMLELVNAAKASGAGAVFAEPQYPQRTGETVAREAGIPFAVLDPVATGPENAPLDYYEQVMRANMATLEQTLGRR